jgi:hypothetical protein
LNENSGSTLDEYQQTTGCLHFYESTQVDSDLFEIKRELEATQVTCVYIDASDLLERKADLCASIALAIRAEHSPYIDSASWLELLDDMITLSRILPGLVIVIDNAGVLFDTRSRDAFDLIEVFSTQLHHWFGKAKPCHLCFQMSTTPMVAEVFKPRQKLET